MIKNAIIAILLLFIVKLCTTNKTTVKTITNTKTSIVYTSKRDSVKLDTSKYKKVLVYKDNPTKILTDTLYIKDSTKYKSVKSYKDTISNKEIDIYSNSLIDGELLSGQISYRLKIKEIIKTKTIEYPRTYRSGLYIFTETNLENLSLGMQYNREGKWFV